MVQVPDVRNGWDTVSLRDAIKGPGQLLGPTNINTQGFSDVWSNDISDVAIQARQAEDAAEAAAWQATKVAKGWTNGVPADASDDRQVRLRDRHAPRDGAQRARLQGSLTKSGDGTLFLTGANTWTGETTVAGGKLSVNGSHTSPIDVDRRHARRQGHGRRRLNVTGGTLQPGLAADEAARIKDVRRRGQRAERGQRARRPRPGASP